MVCFCIFICQVVILSAVLVHDINYGYQNMTNLQLLKVNNQTVKNLKHVVEIIDNSKEDYLRFDFDENAYVPI